MVQNAPLVRPARRVRPGAITIGIIFVGVGVYVLSTWLPDHTLRFDMPTAERIALENDHRFVSPRDVDLVKGLAWGSIVFGAIALIVSSTHRSSDIAFCRKCDQQVIAGRYFFSWRCERCESRVYP